jgi:hypothetical protein
MVRIISTERHQQFLLLSKLYPINLRYIFIMSYYRPIHQGLCVLLEYKCFIGVCDVFVSNPEVR